MASFEIKDELTFEQNWSIFIAELQATDETLAGVLQSNLAGNSTTDPGTLRDAVYKAAKLAISQESSE